MEMALLAAQNPQLTPAELNKLLGKPTSSVPHTGSLADMTPKPARGLFFWRGGPATAPNPAATAKKPPLAPVLAGADSTADKDTMEDESESAQAVPVAVAGQPALTVEQLRLRRQTLELEKRCKGKLAELDKLRTSWVERVNRHVSRKMKMSERLDEAMAGMEKIMETLPDREGLHMEEYWKALETVGIALGHGSVDEQKAAIGQMKNGEEQLMMLDVQIIQEAQLVRQMHLMMVIDRQLSLMRKHTRETRKYLQKCQLWISDKSALEKEFAIAQEAQAKIKSLYQDTLTRQKAAIAKHSSAK